MKKICILLILAVFTLSKAENLRGSVFPKCKKTDENLTKCLTDAANKGWPELLKGDKNWATINLEPVNEEVINIVKGKINNGKITGLEDLHFVEINANLKKQTFNIIFTSPRLSIIGDSEIDGNILGFVLAEKVPVNSTFYGGVYTFHFKYDLKERDGEQYAQITKHGVSFTIDQLYIDLKGPDRTRSGRANKFLNDNWKIVNVLTSSSLGRVFSSGFSSHVGKFLQDVPFNSLFD